ncbi:MAG TPA: tRNA (adenosine(37)-N6)-threonylcarbamoyltransferase complex ATPase subunit type 1 TsaE [Candidatus Saccharimonadales bacterium]
MKKNVNEKELRELGERIGTSVQGGQVIELIGDVGAGKTTLTRAIARGMGITDEIHSPTFTIKNQYDGRDDLRLVHYDFYRLHEAGLMSDELAEAMSDRNAVVVIEWGGIIADVLPEDRTTITIVPNSEDTREFTVTGNGKQSEALIKEAL